MDVIRQDPKMPPEEATELIASAKKAALRMFPGHEQAYDWIYRPRFQRLLNEKYGLQ